MWDSIKGYGYLEETPRLSVFLGLILYDRRNFKSLISSIFSPDVLTPFIELLLSILV